MKDFPYSCMPEGWLPPKGWEQIRPWASVATMSRRELRQDLRLTDAQIDQAMGCADMPKPVRFQLKGEKVTERWICLEVNLWLADLAKERDGGAI